MAKRKASVSYITEGNESPLELEFYKFVIASLPVAVVTVDSNLHITRFNPWAEHITGYTEKEVLGRSCSEILIDGICEHCLLGRALKFEKPVIGIETSIRSKQGKSIPVRMSTAGLFDAAGNLIGGVEAFQDISDLKAYEAEKNNLISMIAHDMKSPVINVHGFAHRLLKKIPEDDKTYYDYLKIIEQEASKLEYLINDFLEFSRLQLGKLALNISATSLDKELHEVHEIYKQRALKNGVVLKLEVPEPLPIINADAARLRRVFDNLLDNAIKYSAHKGAIVITAEATDREVVVRVSDQGVGIDPSDLPHIFEPFHRGRISEDKKGFGLGLAGAKTIVEGHGGSIDVESEPGKGSLFAVRLPR